MAPVMRQPPRASILQPSFALPYLSYQTALDALLFHPVNNILTFLSLRYVHRQRPGTGSGGQQYGDTEALVSALMSAASSTTEAGAEVWTSVLSP